MPLKRNNDRTKYFEQPQCKCLDLCVTLNYKMTLCLFCLTEAEITSNSTVTATTWKNSHFIQSEREREREREREMEKKKRE